MAKQGQTIFSWEAPEFKHYHKTTGWYVAFGIVVITVLTYTLVHADFFGAFTIVCIALLALLFTRKRPNIIPISISTEGFHIHDVHIPYHHVKKFWIVDTEHHRTLNLETGAYLNHFVIIELGDQDPAPIQEFLVQVLNEHELRDPTFSQSAAHRLKL